MYCECFPAASRDRRCLATTARHGPSSKPLLPLWAAAVFQSCLATSLPTASRRSSREPSVDICQTSAAPLGRGCSKHPGATGFHPISEIVGTTAATSPRTRFQRNFFGANFTARRCHNLASSWSPMTFLACTSSIQRFKVSCLALIAGSFSRPSAVAIVVVVHFPLVPTPAQEAAWERRGSSSAVDSPALFVP